MKTEPDTADQPVATPEAAAPVASAKFATITLEEPIARGDTVIAKLMLRKPSAGELRGLSLDNLVQSDVRTLLKLIPRISDPSLTEEEAGRLSFPDLVECGGAISGFFLTKQQREFRDRMIAEQMSKS